MKTGSLLIMALFAFALISPAQDKTPATPGTSKPATPGTSKPAAPDTSKPAAPDTSKPATPDTSKPATPEVTAIAVPDSYVIGASDVVAVSVLKEPTLSSSLLVRPDGMISMPLLGDIKAAGKTPLQLADEVTTKLKKYIQDPNVTIILNQMNSKKVYMIGEIGRTGPVELTPGMTLLQAIATAGGPSPYANVKKMYILRTEGGKQQKIHVEYKQALRGDSSFNLALNPGDTIVVP
jgi:polysaccharide export outer membrane protein